MISFEFYLIWTICFILILFNFIIKIYILYSLRTCNLFSFLQTTYLSLIYIIPMYNLSSYLSKNQKYTCTWFETIFIPSYVPTYNTPTHYVFAYLGQFKLRVPKKRKKNLKTFLGPLFTNYIFMEQM